MSNPSHGTGFLQRFALQVMALVVLVGVAANAIALDLARYLPHEAGNKWSYVNNNSATMSNTFGSPEMLPTGVIAISWTQVDDASCATPCISYNTIDANGFRQHREYIDRVNVAGYGYTSGTVILSPPMTIAPANISVGSTYTSTGTATFIYTNVATVNLTYNLATQIGGFETGNTAGTQSWSALKMINTLTVSGRLRQVHLIDDC